MKWMRASLYEALNEPTKKDVQALLAQAANPDYRSCSTNSDCMSRDQLAGVFTGLGKIIPDLHWTIKDIWTSGNRIVVRGEATGTPTGELFGVKPTGKSFKTISIDMFTALHGERATGETYCIAHHVSVNEGKRTLFVASIRYYDVFAKMEGKWLFAERKLLVDWTDTRPMNV